MGQVNQLMGVGGEIKDANSMLAHLELPDKGVVRSFVLAFFEARNSLTPLSSTVFLPGSG